ncbi:hypothetical protein [Thiomicrorhabdus aquaedulcis]|uniref:hypothetical protein n=1 Tax=Thiomicrorhabdus aquaedulcis TaxID=2211106 RepID=UPI000FD78D06|nr:hypothetical protein [Thiomicrorhabdus aquaedulcis]
MNLIGVLTQKFTQKFTHRILHQIIVAMLLVALLPLGLVWYQDHANKHQLYQNHLINLNSTLRYNVDLIVSHVEQQQALIENIAATPLVGNYFDPLFQYNPNYQQRLANYGQSLIRSGQIFDWFIISLQGDILYSAQAENDLHSNLIHGPYAQTALAQVFKLSRDLLSTELSGLRYYAPSNKYASF